MENESPIINPPQDEVLRKKLEDKLKEYNLRVQGEGAPWCGAPPSRAHALYESFRAAYYKRFILEEVLNAEGPVKTYDVAEKLYTRFGEDFNVESFDIAANVIMAYCHGDHQNLIGGTGLQSPISV